MWPLCGLYVMSVHFAQTDDIASAYDISMSLPDCVKIWGYICPQLPLQIVPESDPTPVAMSIWDIQSQSVAE